MLLYPRLHLAHAMALASEFSGIEPLALRSRQPSRVAATLGNALERVAAPRYREVEQMESALLAAGALGAAMSGSGLTVFGVARSYDHARQIRDRVGRARWACWAVRALRGPAIRIR